MEFFLVILVVLATVGLSNIVNHIFPFLPVPLIQIALGVLLTMIPGGVSIHLEPDLFFVLFIAPLLFNDGKNVPRATLWSLRGPILLLAFGLVFFTVLVVGSLTHWLIPTIPLSAAFALAAILSPTDIVAVSAMSSRVKMPKGILHLLEGEGLMNDASGLVAFNFAIAATVTGVFSLADASLSFLKIAIGGFMGGAFLAFLIIRLRVFIRRLGMEDVTIHMLIQILTPFVVFLAIEHFHLSGILAVVAAGIVHAIERDHEASPAIDLQIVSKSTWTVFLYILNGLVFILLGLQIPDIANEIFNNVKFDNMQAIGFVLIITLSLFFIRFVYLSLSWGTRWILKESDAEKPELKMIGIATISGVRGAVTLAGAFSIPLVLADGSVFPERSLLIFIAAGVILVTLIVASIFLPIITRMEEEHGEDSGEEMERKALIQTQEAAIRAIREMSHEENCEAALLVISNYNRTLHKLKNESKERNQKDRERDKIFKEQEIEIRMKALEAESQFIEKLIEERRIDMNTAYLSQAHIRRMEVAITNKLKYRMLVMWALIKNSLHFVKQLIVFKNPEWREKQNAKLEELSQLKIDMAKAAIQALENDLNPQNKEISIQIIGEYNKQITRIQLLKDEKDAQDFARFERELQEKAFQAERDEVQKLFEKGEITKDVTQRIRQQINIREAYFMEEK